jgi:hypothetical protein
MPQTEEFFQLTLDAMFHKEDYVNALMSTVMVLLMLPIEDLSLQTLALLVQVTNAAALLLNILKLKKIVCMFTVLEQFITWILVAH